MTSAGPSLARRRGRASRAPPGRTSSSYRATRMAAAPTPDSALHHAHFSHGQERCPAQFINICTAAGRPGYDTPASISAASVRSRPGIQHYLP
jgi:hypothetical protein